MIKIVKERIKELEELVSRTPIEKSFAAQSRLTEAKYILRLLEDKSNDL